ANRRGTEDDGHGMAIGYGHPIGASRWDWELHTFADTLFTPGDGFTDFSRYGVGADVRYRFGRGDGFSPFFLIGAGVLRNDVFPEPDEDVDGFGNLGFGFITGGLGQSEIRLRAEVRYVRDGFEVAGEGMKNDRRAAIGVQIPLGKRTVEVEREVVRERVVRETVPAEIV